MLTRNKKIIAGALSIVLGISICFNAFADSCSDVFKSFGDALGGMGSAIDKADKGDTAGALQDYANALGSLIDTTAELSKTTVLQDVESYEEELDEFIKYLGNIDEKMKEQKTSDSDKKKIAKILTNMKEKMQKLVKALE